MKQKALDSIFNQVLFFILPYIQKSKIIHRVKHLWCPLGYLAIEVCEPGQAWKGAAAANGYVPRIS